MINQLCLKIKSNKILLLTLLTIFFTLVYCSLNTLIINDDLGYSFFYRTSTRITNIVQVLKNQISDYRIVSSRVFIHSIVQTLLIFGKNLWSILNPVVIILNCCFINKIINIYVKEKNNKLFNYIFYISLFLLIINYKWIIYWVAGSVNYVWTSTLLFYFLYLYIKYGFSKKNWLNMLIVLIISILHESTFIFTLVFIIFSMILDLLNKKNIKNKFLLFIPLFISGAFLFLGPGTLGRINEYTQFSNLSLIEKLNLSLPVISKNLYDLKNIYNIIPINLIILIIIKLFKIKDKVKYIFISIILLSTFLILILNSNWFYLALSIIILLSGFYINYKDNRNELSIIFISFYAIAYSLCITVDYVFGRPNYFVYIYMIFISLLYIYDVWKYKFKILTVIFAFILTILLFREIQVYKNIGKIKKDRIESIEKYKVEKTNVLEYKLIDDKYSMYQIDSNEPQSKDYYAYEYFINYYNLPSDTKIKFVK